MGKKRAAIYVFYDKDGIVDRFVVFMLREIVKVCDRLIVVCNGDLSETGRKTFRELTEDLIVRENEGYDPWGHKIGMDYWGWENLSEYDELILFNSSIYGPFYPFKTMFDEMDKKKLDFWGITKHAKAQFPKLELCPEGLPEHISLYFYAVRNQMFTHPEFKEYWDNLPALNTYIEAICLHEVEFTRSFSNLGFTWDVYVDTDKELKEYSDIPLIYYMPFELIKNLKMPVMKRKNFGRDFNSVLVYTVGDNTRKAFDYISKETSYDVDMIWEDVLRTMDLYNAKDNLNLNYILPKNYVQDDTIDIDDVKVALMIHLTNEDQVEYCAGYANSIVHNADIYITTSSEYMKSVILAAFSKIKCNKLRIIVLPEKRNGMDASALWVALKPHLENYEYICYIHDGKLSQTKPLVIGRDFSYNCIENVLSSKEYVENILKLFQENPRLGLLFSPLPYHAGFSYMPRCGWYNEFENTAELAKKLKIAVLMNDQWLVFPVGAMMWFRPQALKKLIAPDWKYDDPPEEPMPYDEILGRALERIYCFAAQSEGYYSAWVMTDQFAATVITSQHYLHMTDLTVINSLRENIDLLSERIASITLKGMLKERIAVRLKNYPFLFKPAKWVFLLYKRIKRKNQHGF